MASPQETGRVDGGEGEFLPDYAAYQHLTGAPITHFRGKYLFLSSMAPVANGVETRDGYTVEFAEIGYQADKYDNPDVRARILQAKDGFAAKKLAKIITKGEGILPSEDWPERKLATMRWYVWQKFGRNQPEADMLAETGDRVIIEGNRRDDDEWGACPRPGEQVVAHLYGRNNLGLLLMQARKLMVSGVDLVEDAHRNPQLETGDYQQWTILPK